MIYANDYENLYEFDPVKRALHDMRDEFESHRLEVVLVPQKIHTNEGGCIRVLADQNARWYREFCGRFASSRRRNKALFDTKIKRRNTERALTALIEGRNGGIYGPAILSIARERAENENPF
ncbi:hypothetical protein [Geminisphaera colitermitum]|uniref:hypothetical protein n=1 Tax=Geminisphaera colitermitum TaxID=1148786 RepID=UPI000158C976|nr:hypothetical protein [Geminisphaera colitermitum]